MQGQGQRTVGWNGVIVKAVHVCAIIPFQPITVEHAAGGHTSSGILLQQT